MDKALEFSTFLPCSFACANEQKYLDFLWPAFETNCEAERYEFASLAFHLLYRPGWPEAAKSDIFQNIS